MIKAARALFVIGLVLSLIAVASVFFALTSGDKLLASGALAGADQYKNALQKLQTQIAYYKSHLILEVFVLLAGIAAGVLGLVGLNSRRRNASFFVLEGLCFACLVVDILSGSWLAAAIYLIALALGFSKILSLTKNGAVILGD